jgi:hypothetical protein
VVYTDIVLDRGYKFNSLNKENIMFTEITKTFESNQKLAKELASQLTGASTAFAKTIADVNVRWAETFKAQAAEAYKNLEAFKLPGFEAYSAKPIKK